MAYSFVATAAFERDYDEALAYLIYNLNSPQAAKNLLDAMDASIEKISENPLINAVSHKPSLEALGYREEFVMRYVMLYRVEDDSVVAKRLFHMAQDYESYI